MTSGSRGCSEASLVVSISYLNIFKLVEEVEEQADDEHGAERRVGCCCLMTRFHNRKGKTLALLRYSSCFSQHAFLFIQC